jgi:hypothetical protein
MRKHQVFVFVGDGLGLAEALVVAVLGLADAVLEAVFDAFDVGVVAGAVGVADFDGDPEALADGLLLAEATGTWMMDVAPTEWPADADMLTVSAAEPGEDVSSAALPAGADEPPPPAVPNSRNPPTAMPANPPVSISPTPRRRSARRSERAFRRSVAAVSSAVSADAPRPPAACEPPRADSSATRLACDPPRAAASTARFACGPRRRVSSSSCARPLPCDPPREPRLSAAFAAARASTRDIARVSPRGAAPGPPSRSSDGTCGRACAFARRGPSTAGMRTVVRASCGFESSSPVAPQPGQDTAPLRCLRQVLQ